MCGIAGEFASDPTAQVAAEPIRAMTDAIEHRGPDGEGLRAGPGYVLGHRRLAIVDIAGGAQPLDDGTGQIWVTFNGEIYNHAELRRELEAEGYRFRTACDTEVLVHGYRAWGEGLAARLAGMFAFAIVDEREHVLYAARDRLGKKPFHYCEGGGRLLFASELKALLCRDVPRTISPRSLARYLCLRYVPDPDTIFKGIHKLPPGNQLLHRAGRTEVRPYWRLSFADPRSRPFAELREEVTGLLDDAVRGRLMGEVPLGAFLSGGVDSFAVVDSMSRVSDTSVVACSIGFDDPRFDELPQAREAARACGAELHEEVVRVEDLLDQSWFAHTFDEPFSDSSAIPTYFVSRMARRHVTVALSGDGGDESFAGYRRYRFDARENRLRSLLPRQLFGLAGALYPKLDFMPRWLRFKRTLQNLALEPAVAYARSVSASLPGEILPLLRSPLAEAAGNPLAPVEDAYRAADGPDPLSRAAAADFATYLPGDILTKVDRASMAVSLEVRAPFLDHRMVEFAAGIPSAEKFRGHQTKGFLRRALLDRLGPGVMDRPKQGFSVPLRKWMAGAPGEALESALGADRLGGLLDVGAVGGLLERHRSGVRDHSELLWAVLVLDRFLERWG